MWTPIPSCFKADTYVIADMGNPAAGVPAVTTTLRGNVVVVVKVRSLHHPAHSGLFGGAAPDALLALIRILAIAPRRRRRHDGARSGQVRVVGQRRWIRMPSVRRPGWSMTPQLIGSGTVGARLWSRPVASVIGIDAPSVEGRRQRGDPGGCGQDLDAGPARRRFRK